ncbi:hypothetical protein BKA69DRAFT_611190 [Paraphysoderma sedebokerense]|nr:hypothetical protein BKA69DRAFT_611190 [Paraphysoderma sedebokerense]
MDCDEKIEEDSTSNENNSATRTEEPKLVAASSFSTPASEASEVDQLKTPNPSESSSVSSILLPSPPSVRRESQSSKPPINMLEQLVATETTLNGTGTKDTGLFNKPHSSNDTPTKPTVTDPRGPSQLLRSSTHNGSPLDQQIDAADLSHSEFNSNLNGPSSLFPPSLYTNVQYTSQQQQFVHNVPNSHTQTQQFSQFQSLQSFQNIPQSVNSRHHQPSQDQSLTTPFDILRHVSHGTLAPHIYTLPASSTASSQSSQPTFLDAGIGGKTGTADKNHAPGSSTQLRYSSLSANGNGNNNGNDTSNMNINIDTNGINFSVQNFPQIHLSSLDPLNSLNSLNSLEYSNSLATLHSLNELSIPNLNSLLHSQCQNSNTSSQPVSNQSQVNN